jgi:hypothetical protein
MARPASTILKPRISDISNNHEAPMGELEGLLTRWTSTERAKETHVGSPNESLCVLWHDEFRQ